MCLMNNIVSNYLDKFIVIFNDDILIQLKNKLEHEEQLRIILQVLIEQQLFVTFRNRHFFKDRIQYLGHVVSKYGILVECDNIKSITEWLVPKNVIDIRSFMGITGYY